VTKNGLSRALRTSEVSRASKGTWSRWSRLHLQSLAPTNPHRARVVGYGPFSLCSTHKEGLFPSSGGINRLMMMMTWLVKVHQFDDRFGVNWIRVYCARVACSIHAQCKYLCAWPCLFELGLDVFYVYLCIYKKSILMCISPLSGIHNTRLTEPTLDWTVVGVYNIFTYIHTAHASSPKG
jgi:hypothetical protein